MSTRGLCGFRLDGKDYLAYNHSDSYPDCLGLAVLEFARDAYMEALPDKVRSLRLVDEETKPTPEDVAALSKYTDLNVSNQSTDDWYCLLRNAQGNLDAYLQCGYMPDNSASVADSLFMEWAYIINLDESVVEVYRGFNTVGAGAGGRYAGLCEDDRRKYFGIALLMSIPFDALHKVPIESWVHKMNQTDNDEAA